MNSQHFARAVEFGKALIITRDLDPVYIALTGADLRDTQLSRTLLAYFCLYHLGAAAYIGEQKGREFWDTLMVAAINEDHSWPRGTERRHWRGQAAVTAASWLQEQYYERPESVVYNWFNNASSESFTNVSHEVRKVPSFGPWMAFKVCDMMERVLRIPVDFSDCALGVYSEPRAGAALVLTGSAEEKITDKQLNDVICEFLKHPQLRSMKAPPHKDRIINVQEVETILCKYKSHCNGHYPPGKDLREVIHGLEGWGRAARRMKEVMESYV